MARLRVTPLVIWQLPGKTGRRERRRKQSFQDKGITKQSLVTREIRDSAKGLHSLITYHHSLLALAPLTPFRLRDCNQGHRAWLIGAVLYFEMQ